MSKFNQKNISDLASKWEWALWVISVIAVLAIGSLLSWKFWGQLHNPQDPLSTVIRNVGLVIGGVVAVLLAIWRSRVAERQVATSQQGLMNERYQRGAEMLGHEVLAVRLGGIYALQRLAAERPEQYHIQIMELFCAFVRFPTDDKMMGSCRLMEEQDGTSQTLRPDVQDTMRFLGSRSQDGIHLEWKEDFKLYLRDANLSNLQAADANFSRAWLRNANLSNTVLIRADLSGARLRKANLSKSRLQDANLSRASLNGANLSNASLDGANLSYASLNRANLSSNVSLNHANLSNASLHYANLSYASLQEANLSGADSLGVNLFQANLAEANLSNARFWEANLSQANLADADLSNASFREADLSHADLAAADLTGANLEDANLTGTSFSIQLGNGGRWLSANGLTQAQLDIARSDPSNPPGLEGVCDAETGEHLIWQGGPVDDDS